jgi:prefoldin subunit 5
VRDYELGGFVEGEEFGDVRLRIGDLESQVASLEAQLSALQATDAELTRMIGDLQNP